MNEIPDLEEGLKQFRRFLVENGLPDHVFWVFREDLWRLSPTRVLVRYPPPSANISLAQKVFAEGRERGLVEITTVAATAEDVAASVWFPKYPNEEVQGWERGMKLSITQPIARATLVAGWRWNLIRLLPGFRQYQRRVDFIGTRAWAAA